LDQKFLRQNRLTGLVKQAAVKWQNEPGKTNLRRRLEPFLFHANEARKLELFGAVVNRL
jgi:hypothetical protein